MLPKCLMLAASKNIQNNCLNTFQIGMTSLMHFIFRVRYVSYLSNVFTSGPVKVDHFPAKSISILSEWNFGVPKRIFQTYKYGFADFWARPNLHAVGISRILGERAPDIGHSVDRACLYAKVRARISYMDAFISLFRMSYLKWLCMWKRLHSMNYDLVA